jgi:hypothetical protein
MIYLRRLSDRLVKFWFPLLVVLVLLVAWSPLNAAPIAQLSENDLVVTLYDEPCRLDVKLQYRIVWKDKEKTYEGCFGVIQGIVVGYFSDKSIGLFPGHAFRPLTNS